MALALAAGFLPNRDVRGRLEGSRRKVRLFMFCCSYQSPGGISSHCGWGSWFCSPPPSFGTPPSTIRRTPFSLRSEFQICGMTFPCSWGSFRTTSSSLVASTHIRMTCESIFPSHTSLQYYAYNRHPILTLNLWMNLTLISFSVSRNVGFIQNLQVQAIYT